MTPAILNKIELHQGAIDWVRINISKLPPQWHCRAAQRYDEHYNWCGVFIPHQEQNERLYRANVWLRLTVKRYQEGEL